MSEVVRVNGELYIFYNASFKPYEPLVLAHEIGHIAAGHFNCRHQPDLFTGEFEADYFSQLVNDVSAGRYYAYLTVDSAFMAKEIIMRPFMKKREVERLQGLGVYHLL